MLVRGKEKFDYDENDDNDPNFDRKLDEVTAGLQPYVRNHLLTRLSRANAAIIIDFVLALKSEVNPTDYYRIMIIMPLKLLSEFHQNNNKSFKEITRNDILRFVDRLTKPEDSDLLHHWIGRYNNNVIVINRFFKWLYADLEEYCFSTLSLSSFIGVIIRTHSFKATSNSPSTIFQSPSYVCHFFRSSFLASSKCAYSP